MAGIAIPLIAGVLPNIIDLIAALVHKSAPAAEQQLGAGTGPAKLSMVFGDVIGLLQNAAAQGTIPKALPPDDTIKLIIQAVISSMKAQGLLTSAIDTAAFPAGAQTITLKPGMSLVVVGG